MLNIKELFTQRNKLKRTIPKEYKHAFLLHKDDLKNIYNFLADHFETISIYVKCSDNSHFLPKNIDELLTYENPNYRKITLIKFDMQKPGETCLLKIGIDSILFSNSALIEVKIDGLNNDGVLNELDKKLQELKPWYSILTYWDFTIVLPLIVFLPLLVIAFLQNLTGIASKLSNDINTSLANQVPTSSMFTDSEQSTIVYSFFFLIIIFGYLIDRSKNYLFPKVFFVIGKQEKNLNRIDFWRYGVILTLIVGIASSTIASFLN